MVRIPVTLADFDSGRIKSSISKLSKHHPYQPVKPKRSLVQQTFAQILGYGGYEELRSEAKQNGATYFGPSLVIEQFMAAISLRISRYWSVSAEKAEYVAAALGLKHLDAFRPTARTVHNTILREDSVSQSGHLPNIGLSPRPIFDAVHQATVMPMAQMEALQEALKSMVHMAAIPDAIKPVAQMAALHDALKSMVHMAAIQDALKPMAQMAALHDALNPLAQMATLHDALNPSAQMAAIQDAMMPMAQMAALQDALNPSAQMAALQDALKPMAQMAALQDALKPSAQIVAIQDAVKPMAQMSALQDALKPLAQIAAIQDAMKPMAHIAAILDSLKSAPH